MNNHKILFTDLDDTLLNRRKEVSTENYAAIKEALLQGHRIVINTGRPLIGALPLIEKLHLDKEGCYAITYNGGQIYDCCRKEIIFQKTIPAAYTDYIFQAAKEHGLYCHTYDSQSLVATEDSRFLRFYVETTKVPYRIDPKCPGNLTEEVVKILIVDTEDHPKIDRYRQDMLPWARGKIDMFYSSPYYLEHVATGISKGNAMIRLCEMLNIPMENTVGIGDAENDLPMIQTAHIGVSMSNGEPMIKNAADYITENDCDHHGVAEVIHKFILDN